MHAQIEVPSTDHGKGIGAGKIGCPLHLAYGFLASIDQVAILFAFHRIRANAEHSILRLQNHVHARRHVIGNQRRHSDAKIYVKAIAQLPGNSPDDALAFVGIFHGISRWSLVVGLWPFAIDFGVIHRSFLPTANDERPTTNGQRRPTN
jgi:hypothetical protein